MLSFTLHDIAFKTLDDLDDNAMTSDSESDPDYVCSSSNEELVDTTDYSFSDEFNSDVDLNENDSENERNYIKHEEEFRLFSDCCDAGEEIYDTLVSFCSGPIINYYQITYFFFQILDYFDFNIPKYIEIKVKNGVNRELKIHCKKSIKNNDDLELSGYFINDDIVDDDNTLVINFIPNKKEFRNIRKFEKIKIESIKFNKLSDNEINKELSERKDFLYCVEDIDDNNCLKLRSFHEELSRIFSGYFITKEYLKKIKEKIYLFNNIKSRKESGKILAAYLLFYLSDNYNNSIKFIGSKILFDIDNNTYEFIKKKVNFNIIDDDNDDDESKKKRIRNSYIVYYKRKVRKLKKKIKEIREEDIDRNVYAWIRETWTPDMVTINDEIGGYLFGPEQEKDNYDDEEIEEINRKVALAIRKDELIEELKESEKKLNHALFLYDNGLPIPRLKSEKFNVFKKEKEKEKDIKKRKIKKEKLKRKKIDEDLIENNIDINNNVKNNSNFSFPRIIDSMINPNIKFYASLDDFYSTHPILRDIASSISSSLSTTIPIVLDNPFQNNFFVDVFANHNKDFLNKKNTVKIEEIDNEEKEDKEKEEDQEKEDKKNEIVVDVAKVD